MTHQATIKLQQLQSRMVVGVCGAVVILFSIYIYFVCASVTHVVVRSEVIKETQLMQAEINALEAKYISVQHDVSARVASLDGYVPVTKKQFIDRSVSSLVLSER